MAGDNIQALTFDVFGTVVDWRNSIAREGAALGDRLGIDLDWQRFALDWRALYQPAMERVRSGAEDFVKLDVLHRRNLDELLARYELSGLSEAEIDDFNRAWHRLDPWPDTVQGLARLKQRFILATLSNGNMRLIVEMAKRAGLPWDAVLGAEVARAYKPQPQAYLNAADYLSLNPGECMMVAAHNDDLVAAAACGFRTAFVLRPDEYGPDQAKDLRAEHDFDVVADDFLDLADKLGC
ncbi:MAG: haloacid dehalogenase type II [Alphaproteobacteria bacterium]|nr:haloacid dehalogenase type II [Alphaproteobacteria bacterium]